MTKAKISEYDAVAANNTDVNGVNISEGCPPSSMNNMGREIMAALKRFETGADGDSLTVGGSLVVSGTATTNTLTAGPVSATTLNTSGAVVFNDAGADVDFRVEGDTDANLLFVDAGNDRVGVGSGSPSQKFQVSGQDISLKGYADNRIRFSLFDWAAAADNMGAAIGYIYTTANTQEQGNLAFYTNPNFNGTGSLTERVRISSAGTVTFNAYGAGTLSTNASGVISASDGRYKTKTRNIDTALPIIESLQPTYFRWGEDSPFASEHEELGFIAQEVAEVIPEASPGEDEEGKYRNYHDRAILAMLVKAIQELKAELDAAKERIAALENV